MNSIMKEDFAFLNDLSIIAKEFCEKQCKEEESRKKLEQMNEDLPDDSDEKLTVLQNVANKISKNNRNLDLKLHRANELLKSFDKQIEELKSEKKIVDENFHEHEVKMISLNYARTFYMCNRVLTNMRIFPEEKQNLIGFIYNYKSKAEEPFQVKNPSTEDLFRLLHEHSGEDWSDILDM